ncbi:TrbI/VirB10 family protein [Paremcibacter congregatus]|uniref:TrbI/VirB10 family protein n=1 Tax=Paremcibacter congregatus TaxID=2043170 RepID=UPI003A8EDD70
MEKEPEDISLRASPKPVTRFNRRYIMTASAAVILLLFAASFYGLSPRERNVSDQETQYHVERKSVAEGLDTLPKSYDPAMYQTPKSTGKDTPLKLPGEQDVPKLGAPLPGDLGSVILDAEQGAGFLPDPMLDAERAARIRMRKRAAEAREANVFFSLSGQKQGASSAQATGLQAASVADTSNGNDGAGDLQVPTSPYTLMAGSIIAAHLMTGINSDLPGTVLAQVSENVYDTVTGKHLLIPQGARLIGTYDSQTETGQERALVVWQRLIWPDGSSILLDNLPASDKSGYAGLKDTVDHHSGRLLRGITLATLLGVGTELAASDGDGRLIAALKNSVQSTAGDVGQRLVDRDLNIKPTITIRPGWPVRVITLRDLILKPYGSTP